MVALGSWSLSACASSSSRHGTATTLASGGTAALSSGGPALATTTTVIPLVANGLEAPGAAVPWAQVGPGWLLATWSAVPGRSPGPPPSDTVAPVDQTVVLFLVDPLGGRYRIASLPVSDQSAPPTLEDWSGDGRHALFLDFGQHRVTEVDLVSGQATTSFTSADATSVSFSRPSGRAILVSSSQVTGGPSLVRVDLYGHQEQSYPAAAPDVGTLNSGFGRVLSRPDGTQIVVGATGGLALVANGGQIARELAGPGGRACDPMRWWTTDVVVASCQAEQGTQLWLMPISGASPTALTAPLPAQNPGPDYGDLNAWQLDSGTYVQDAGACGMQYLARLNPDATTSPVAVPGVDTSNSVLVVGSYDNMLALRATIACGSGVSLIWFDPTADTANVVLGPPINGGGVIDAVPYPGEA